jgi:hypothetical protein
MSAGQITDELRARYHELAAMQQMLSREATAEGGNR